MLIWLSVRYHTSTEEVLHSQKSHNHTSGLIRHSWGGKLSLVSGNLLSDGPPTRKEKTGPSCVPRRGTPYVDSRPTYTELEPEVRRLTLFLKIRRIQRVRCHKTMTSYFSRFCLLLGFYAVSKSFSLRVWGLYFIGRQWWRCGTKLRDVSWLR